MKQISLLIIMVALSCSLLGQRFGNAINLDGIDDYLVVPHHESLNPGNGSWSVVFWIKAANKDQIAPIVMKRFPGDPYTQYSYGFGKDDPHDPEPGKRFRVNHIQFAGNSERSGHIIEEVIDGGWHHIAVVANKVKDRIEIYIDGLLKEFVALYYYGAWPTVETTTDLIIAKGSSDDKVEGLLDEMSIWNKALDHSQIIRCMHDTLSTNYYSSADSNLVAYYRFDTLRDLNINGNGADDFQDLSVWGNHADAEGSPELVESIVTPDTIYVDQNNISGNENGTEEYPFNTLAEGMNAASGGKTLFIKNGNYNPEGGILYLKAGVKLVGESKEGSVINANLNDTTYSNLPVGINNLTFRNFNFGRGVFVNEQISEKSYVTDCICQNIFISHGGGLVNDTTPGPIHYFEIKNNQAEQDIGFKHGAGKIVGKNVVSGNKARAIGLSHGFVQMTDDPFEHEVGYLFENNEITGEFGFSQGGSIGVEIIVRNNQADAITIRSGGGYTYTITNNTFQSGYFDSGGANWTVFSNNTIVNGRIVDSSRGIDDDKEDAVIENNVINYTYNGEDDPIIIEVRAASVSLKNNTIIGDGRLTGISLKSGYPTNVISNNINIDKDNLFDPDVWDQTAGILTKAGGGVITGNTIYGGYYGYYSNSGATEFSNNEITNAHHGFMSNGFEEVKNNVIKNCTGHGMIVAGLNGPIHNNTIIDNDSAGIYMIRNIGLGGPDANDLGRNIIKNNSWYDLVINYESNETDTVYAQNNVWDHESLSDILQYDILNLYPGNVSVNVDSFIVTPDAPILLTPENNVTEVDTFVSLSWQVSVGVDSFHIQVALNPEFNPIIYEISGINDLNHLLGSLDFNTTYYWRCKATNLAGESGWSEAWQFTTKIPTGIDDLYELPFDLFQIYPNPFKEISTISYSLRETGFVSLKVYDIMGKEMAILVNKEQPDGEYKVEFNGSRLGKGIYLCRMVVGSSIKASKMILFE